jgi:hypothetical protein
MNKNAIFLTIGIAAILAVAIAPMFGTASAKITPECTNNGGQTQEGPCTGNPNNKKTCEAVNPAGKPPGGHNPC